MHNFYPLEYQPVYYLSLLNSSRVITKALEIFISDIDLSFNNIETL